MSAVSVDEYSPRKEDAATSVEEGALEKDLGIVPKHVAVIMDGNRRWAERRGLLPMMGHLEGASALTDIVQEACDLGIETLTVYAFSTENWSRSPEEVEMLLHIFELYLLQKKQVMVEKGIRLDMIGDLSRFPHSVQETFHDVKKATEQGNKINLVLALNYGGRDEIRRALVKILAEYQQCPFALEECTEEWIAQFLDTKPWGDPDLLIRTSGELRLSNFLLWQVSYTEFYIVDKLWPEFSPQDFRIAITAYQQRKRRLGG